MSSFLVKAHLLDDHRKFSRVVHCETVNELVEQIYKIFDIFSSDGYVIRYVSQKYEQEIELNSTTTSLHELPTRFSCVISSRPRWEKTNSRVNEKVKIETRIKDLQLSEYYKSIVFPPDPNQSLEESLLKKKTNITKKKRSGSSKTPITRKVGGEDGNHFENRYFFPDQKHLEYLIKTNKDRDLKLEEICEFIFRPEQEVPGTSQSTTKKKDKKKKAADVTTCLKDKIYLIYFWIKEKIEIRTRGIMYSTLEEVITNRKAFSYNFARLFQHLSNSILLETPEEKTLHDSFQKQIKSKTEEKSDTEEKKPESVYILPQPVEVIRGRFKHQESTLQSSTKKVSHKVSVKSSYWNLMRIEGELFFVDCYASSKHNSISRISETLSFQILGWTEDETTIFSTSEKMGRNEREEQRTYVKDVMITKLLSPTNSLPPPPEDPMAEPDTPTTSRKKKKNQKKEKNPKSKSTKNLKNSKTSKRDLSTSQDDVSLSSVPANQELQLYNLIISQLETSEIYTPRSTCGRIDDVFYFCVPPSLFIRTHVPDKNYMQLVPTPTTQKSFERAVCLSPLSLEHGVEPLFNETHTRSRTLKITNSLSLNIHFPPSKHILYSASVQLLNYTHQHSDTFTDATATSTSRSLRSTRHTRRNSPLKKSARKSNKSKSVSTKYLPFTYFLEKEYLSLYTPKSSITDDEESVVSGSSNSKKSSVANSRATSSKKQVQVLQKNKNKNKNKKQRAKSRIQTPLKDKESKDEESTDTGTRDNNGMDSDVDNDTDNDMESDREDKRRKVINRRVPSDILTLNFPEFGKKYLVKFYFSYINTNRSQKNREDISSEANTLDTYNSIRNPHPSNNTNINNNNLLISSSPNNNNQYSYDSDEDVEDPYIRLTNPENDRRFNFSYFQIIQPVLKKNKSKNKNKNKTTTNKNTKISSGLGRTTNSLMSKVKLHKNKLRMNSQSMSFLQLHDHEYCIISRKLYELKGTLHFPRKLYLHPAYAQNPNISNKNQNSGNIAGTGTGTGIGIGVSTTTGTGLLGPGRGGADEGGHRISFMISFGVSVESVYLIDTQKERELGVLRRKEREQAERRLSRNSNHSRRTEMMSEEEGEEEEGEGESESDIDDEDFLEEEIVSQEKARIRRIQKMKKQGLFTFGSDDILEKFEKQVLLGDSEENKDNSKIEIESSRSSQIVQSEKSSKKVSRAKSKKTGRKSRTGKNKKSEFDEDRDGQGGYVKEVWKGTLYLRKVPMTCKEIRVCVILKEPEKIEEVEKKVVTKSSSRKKKKRKEEEKEEEEKKTEKKKIPEEDRRVTVVTYKVMDRYAKRRKRIAGSRRNSRPTSSQSRRNN